MRISNHHHHHHRVDDFAVDVVARDMVDLASSLGFDQMVVVGHDFGAYLAWHLALLYSKVVVGVMALSTPYMGHVPTHQPLMAALQRRFGKCLPNDDKNDIATTTTRSDQLKARFHYMLHHNLPFAHVNYDINIREALYRIYAYQPGVEVESVDDNHCLLLNDDRMFIPPFFKEGEHDHHGKIKANTQQTSQPPLLDGRSAPALWQRLPRPKKLPSWLSSTDLDIMVQEVEQSGGFAGGLRWYQALDLNWYRTRHYLRHAQIHQPCYFMMGSNDTMILENHGGSFETIQQRMQQHVTNLQKCMVIPHAGHWLPLECATLVNEELLSFYNMMMMKRQSTYHHSSNL
jgi:pimeloyl-ACP methyl ester carboxylesterase